MPLYLAGYEGDGTAAVPFRPAGVTEDTVWHTVDLRPDPTTTAGWCILRTDVPVSGPELLGELDDSPNRPATRQLKTRLGLGRDVLAGSTWRQIIVDLLVVHGDDTEPRGRWKKLAPDRGRLRVWLGEMLVDMPIPAGGATETWTVPDQDNNIDADFDWTILAGQYDIDSGAVSEIIGASDAWAICEEDIGTVDHEATLHGDMPANQSGRNLWFGPAVRFDGPGQTNYHMQFLVRSGNSNAARLFKWVSGSGTQLSNPSWSSSNNAGSHTFRLSVSGSTLTWFVDAVEVASATDTSVVAGTRVGIFTNRNTGYSGTSLYPQMDFTDPVVGGGQTIPLGRATESDTARPAAVVSPRTYLLGRTSETNVVRPVTVDNPRTVVLGRTAEVDEARPLSISQPGAVILGRAVESDAARGLTVVNPRSYLLGRTTEADTARPVAVRQGTTIPLGRATEAGVARPLTVSNPRTYLLARAAEVDAARTLATVNPRTIMLGRVVEVDVARGLVAHVGDPVVFVAPAVRTLTVVAEDRTFVVAAEDRTYVVDAEDRTLTVTR